jgi:integrase
MKLTARAIAGLQLPPDKAERIWFDQRLPGYGIRLRTTAAATWIYQYELPGRSRRITIGKVAAIPPAKAFQIAGELHSRVRLGGDPAADAAVSRAAAAKSLKSIIDQYLARQKTELRPRSYVEVARHLLTHAKPLHDRSVTAIDRGAIATLLNNIANTSGAVATNRVRSSLSAMFSWAMKEGIAEVQSNPVANTNKRAEATRDTVLSDAELATVWRSLPGNRFGDIVRLLALTLQRRDEIGGLRWSEIDFQKGMICLPASRTKSGRAHQVPMAPAVSEILQAQPRIEGRDVVFGGDTGNGYSGWSKSKRLLDEAVTKTNNGKPICFALHDLRRSAATKMSEDLQIQSDTIELILNHAAHRTGLRGVYNRSHQTVAKTQALIAWAARVTAIVTGQQEGNVVSLRA